MSYCCNEKCIEPQNVQITLKRVFEFIRQNQLTDLGFLAETTVLLKISLINLQVPMSDFRNSATNTVTGTVTDITDTYVVLVAKSGCDEIYTEYTIAYNKIIYVENYNVYVQYNQFLDYVSDHTPKLCYEVDNQYLDMLNSLKTDLIKYKNDETIDFKLIFAGVNTRRVYKKDLIIIRNLVLFEKAFIFPITAISGYIVAPVCSTASETVQNNSESEGNKKKGGVFNAL